MNLFKLLEGWIILEAPELENWKGFLFLIRYWRHKDGSHRFVLAVIFVTPFLQADGLFHSVLYRKAVER